MKVKRLLLIQGHPDPSAAHLCHALLLAYAAGARAADHTVRHVTVSELDKGFLEQVARPGFAFSPDARGNPIGKKALAGRSARVVVTMGMPALVYRWYFQAHSIKSLRRNILGLCGIAPVRNTLIGRTGNLSATDAAAWIEKLKQLGRRAQ